MRRIAAAATIALAMLAGTARGDTFSVVPASGGAFTAPVVLPAPVPNAPGALTLPPDFTAPPAVPEQRTPAQLLALWQRAGAAYGVPWQVLAAINKVESNFGRNMGPSSAGAIGWMQFMPSTWLRWGTDANGDGIADPWNPEDAVYSAARYLAAAGAATDVYRAVFAYNHADWYVTEVLDLAGLYKQGSAVAFSLDRLQVQLDQARSQVVDVNRRVVAQRVLVRRLARAERPWRLRAARAQLFSDRLEAEQHAGRIELRRQAAEQVAKRLEKRLASARATLVQARAQAQPATFDQGVGTLMRAPTYSGGYVFPVGGGPRTVSVSHTHHDYPAADIAAPAGSPVYALADAVVLRAWTYPDPRCGIGLTLRAFDGQVWTYCHLAYEEPSVQPGAHLAAGQPVGLVGSTGDATGPHLHLQLQPATAWPQQEQWFQSFAGSAFSWQDAVTPLEPGGGPVFQIADTPAPAAAAPGTAPPRRLSSVVPSASWPTFAVVSGQGSTPIFFTR